MPTSESPRIPPPPPFFFFSPTPPPQFSPPQTPPPPTPFHQKPKKKKKKKKKNPYCINREKRKKKAAASVLYMREEKEEIKEWKKVLKKGGLCTPTSPPSPLRQLFWLSPGAIQFSSWAASYGTEGIGFRGWLARGERGKVNGP